MAKTVIAPTSTATDLSVAKATEILKLHREIVAVFLKGAKLAYKAGSMLYEIQMRTDAYQWNDWVRDVLKLSLQTVNRYITIYEAFKGKPEELEDLTMKDALHRAALEFYAKKPREKTGRIEYGNPTKQLEFDWEAVFAKPPVSKAKLKNYRFECPDQRSLWMVKRGMDFAVKYLDLFTDRPNRELRSPYETMMKTIQGAVELYFEKVEQTEAAEEEE